MGWGGGHGNLYFKENTQQRNKGIVPVFQDSKMPQVSGVALRMWSKLKLSNNVVVHKQKGA